MAIKKEHFATELRSVEGLLNKWNIIDDLMSSQGGFNHKRGGRFSNKHARLLIDVIFTSFKLAAPFIEEEKGYLPKKAIFHLVEAARHAWRACRIIKGTPMAADVDEELLAHEEAQVGDDAGKEGATPSRSGRGGKTSKKNSSKKPNKRKPKSKVRRKKSPRERVYSLLSKKNPLHPQYDGPAKP